MLIPYSTDAPIYYWPFATVGLIVANVVCYVVAWQAIGVDEMVAFWWMLPLGYGITPVQWLTSFFMHADVIHLAGNMLFLWVFGLVVEGKLGWWKFLACYLGIGLIESIVVQVACLGLSEVRFALGASGAIYGIMLMAVIWAPRNEVSCVTFARFAGSGSFDIPIVLLASFYLCFDLFYMVVGYLGNGSILGSGILHVTGALLGGVLGVTLLKLNLVDCEGWDLFNAWNDADQESRDSRLDKEADLRVAEKKKAHEQKLLRDAADQIATFVGTGNFIGAERLWTKMQTVGGGPQLERETLVGLIRGLQSTGHGVASVPLLKDLVNRFPQGADPARLQLAQLLVTQCEKPAQAMQFLKEIDFGKQPPERVALAKKIAARARKLQEEGIYELDDNA